jgi:alpha/beta superfamily hydrolase
MKREEEFASLEAGEKARHAVHRRPMHFGDEGLFGWFHDCRAAAPRDCVAVICPPVGPEYTRSHRTLRHLADRLARAGIPALRFDYHGIGDSAGEDDDPDRVWHWRNSIHGACLHALASSGRTRLCLVGVRLGASLAALEAAESRADLLVLWNPVVKGRAYARELQAMAMTARTATAADDGALESAGFRVPAETLTTLKALDLTTASFPPAARVLVVDRDDLASDGALVQRLASDGAAHDRLVARGWNDMMADHQFTVVPDAALDAIRDWAVKHTQAAARPPAPAPDHPARALAIGHVKERLCLFGADRHLFGVLTLPRIPAGKPAVLLLNAGSIHHVGPHRLYTRLARELAADGHPVLRFDVEGVGDSVLRGPGRENHPYPPRAVADIADAMAVLRREHACGSFVLMGLCSGAYHAFRAGLQLVDAPIERLVLVNPWYFEWKEGASLDTTTNHYEHVAAYSASARDPERWKKLLLGEVDIPRLVRIAGAHAVKIAKGRWKDLHEMMAPSAGTQLSRDLIAIGRLGRPIQLYQSDGEPGAAILATEAARASRRLTRAGLLKIERIVGGDHTFSQSDPRDRLVARIRALLAPQPAGSTTTAVP